MSTTYFDFPTYDVERDKMEFPKQINDLSNAIDIALEGVYQKIPSDDKIAKWEHDIHLNSRDIVALDSRVHGVESDLRNYDEILGDFEDRITSLESKIEPLLELLENPEELATLISDVSSIKEWIQNHHDVENLDLFMSGGVII